VSDYWDRCDPHWIDGEGAESFVDFVGRIDDTIGRLQERVGETIMVFCHGYVIHAMETRLDSLGELVDAAFMDRFFRTWPANAPARCEVRRRLLGF
jgi:broad specificity phosphatase PhoE